MAKTARRQTPPDGPSALAEGRDAYARRAWEDAYRALSLADQAAPLAVDDLDRLGLAAALTGRGDDFVKTLERIHNLHLEAGEALRAARSAFWLGMRLTSLGEIGRATGWLGRAERLIEGEGRDCVESGYLLLPTGQRYFAAGDFESAIATAARAAAIGDRFGERELSSLRATGRAMHWLGKARSRPVSPSRRSHGRGYRGRAIADHQRTSSTAASSPPASASTPSTGRANGPRRSPTGAPSSRRSSPSAGTASSTAPRSCS